MSFGLTSGNCL